MRKVVSFIAMSLDGYIADEHGNVGWLNGQDISVENIDTYSVFVRDVDTVIMGWNTYHQIVTELFIRGYKGGFVKDTSYKGLWKVSFTLKEC